MKNSFGFLLIFALFLGACGGDDENPSSNVFTNAGIELSYDDENFSAPQLPEGQYEMAIRLPASQMSQYEGQFLRDIAVYLTNVPAATEVYIYAEGANGLQQGEQLYYANISASVSTDSWNQHTLSTPVEINGGDLWISIFVDHPQNIGSVGCDRGPATNNGDLVYEYGTSDWTTLRQFTNNLSDVNWNIRGNIR